MMLTIFSCSLMLFECFDILKGKGQENATIARILIFERWLRNSSSEKKTFSLQKLGKQYISLSIYLGAGLLCGSRCPPQDHDIRAITFCSFFGNRPWLCALISPACVSPDTMLWWADKQKCPNFWFYQCPLNTMHTIFFTWTHFKDTNTVLKVLLILLWWKDKLNCPESSNLQYNAQFVDFSYHPLWTNLGSI